MTNLDLINYIFEPIFGEKPFVDAEIVKTSAKPRFVNGANMPAVKQVVFSNDVTLVYFTDGTCSIVRKTKGDEYSREHAVVYAIVKRAYGKIDPNSGVVKGNGRMGNMLAKLLENAVDQGAIAAKKKAKKAAAIAAAAKKNAPSPKHETVDPWPTPTPPTPPAEESKTAVLDDEKCEECPVEDCDLRRAPFDEKKSVREQKRAEGSRFAVKSNRK